MDGDPDPDRTDRFERTTVDPPRSDEADDWVSRVKVSQVPTRPERPVVAGATKEGVDAVLTELRRPSAERLSVLARHAEGGMGSIELVVDRALSRRMAMKVMHPALQTEARNLRMFLREARVTAQLEHPGIVPVHDAGEDPDGRFYFTMKLVEGRTLKEVLRSASERPPTGDELYNMLDVAIRVCDALAFAHSRGVLHCDIKPSNVMVGDFGEAYLMDWGIARLLTDRPREGDAPTLGPATEEQRTDEVIMGTASYMSPEQALGFRDRLDARSDVYQMGCLLYEVLTQRPPFKGGGFEESLNLAREAQCVPLGDVFVVDGPPRELVRIVTRAMAPVPSNRYQTIEDLKDDLVRFLRGGGEFPRVAYAKGEHIIRENEEGHTAYIVASGKLEIYRVVDGERVVLGVLGPGEVFGETAVLTSQPRNASVITLEATTLYVVSSETIDREIDAMKPWLGSLLRTLARRQAPSD